MPSNINATHICLISKKFNPQKITDYCPISLSNVLSRIISKVFASRLKQILPDVISTSQSAFLSDRLIIDNILVAFETMHHINQRQKGKDGLMAIKLDISKAFDRVKWPCLERIMRKLGFHDRWISLIMMCVTTISYLILLNGEPRGMIRPTRGIRRGDPISPYLFLLCVERLSAMLKKEELQGHIKGVSVYREAPPISHLLFVNDSLIFCKANMIECNKVWKVLGDYEATSGQWMNREKTFTIFQQKHKHGNLKLHQKPL